MEKLQWLPRLKTPESKWVHSIWVTPAMLNSLNGFDGHDGTVRLMLPGNATLTEWGALTGRAATRGITVVHDIGGLGVPTGVAEVQVLRNE